MSEVTRALGDKDHFYPGISVFVTYPKKMPGKRGTPGHGKVPLVLVSSLMILSGFLSWWRSASVMLVAPRRRSRLSLDLVAFMVDGVHFGEHVCVVALGITIDGVKVPLAIEEGSTEDATLVTSLIVGRERGLDVTRPILAVLDGSRALARAVKDVFDYP